MTDVVGNKLELVQDKGPEILYDVLWYSPTSSTSIVGKSTAALASSVLLGPNAKVGRIVSIEEFSHTLGFNGTVIHSKICISARTSPSINPLYTPDLFTAGKSAAHYLVVHALCLTTFGNCFSQEHSCTTVMGFFV